MERVEKNLVIFTVEDINGEEKMFFSEKEALEFEEKVLIIKQREEIRLFVRTAFPDRESRLHYGTFSVDDIVDGIFNHINLLKNLDI